MTELNEPKAVLHRYLKDGREALLWKLDGLSERELRLPRTPTGTNLIGIVKHLANVEIGYFADTFGRSWQLSHQRVTDAEFDVDPQADWYATANESCADILAFYREVAGLADATIESLALDAPGRVPWWSEDRNPVTLARILVHVLTDLSRHLGQADILREHLDGAAGMPATASNLPEDMDWPGYVAKLTALADQTS